jgi:hypothetical protein
MIKPLRKRHLQIWTACAALIPIGIISAVIVRPRLPKDKLLQPAAIAALPVILKSIDKDNYTLSIRSNVDTSLLQLEWINKKTLTYPTATIYEDTITKEQSKVSPVGGDLEGAVLIGRIEARGTYHFALKKSLIHNNYRFILYDFIHKQIIDSIAF